MKMNDEFFDFVKDMMGHNIAFNMSLVEVLMSKGILNENDLTKLKKKQILWLSKLDQMHAENKDKTLNSKSEDGTKARMTMAMTAITKGDLKEFRKWIDLEKKIRNNK